MRKAREADPDLKNTEAFKMAGEKWGTMTEKDKAPYEKLHQEDLKRVEKQEAERQKKGFFTLEDKSKSTDPDNAKLFKKKSKKSVGQEEEPQDLQPKRANGAYTFFNTDFVREARAKDPELKTSDCFKLAGEKWATMSEKQKEPYEKLALKDKARNEKQKAELAKKGYFLLEDGSKSTDPQNVPKPKKSRKRDEKSVEAPRKSAKDAKAAVAKAKK